MTGLPRRIAVAALLATAGLAATVPLSNPDGTGMQWDELVLGALAVWTCWSIHRVARAMTRPASLPWRVMGVGAGLFATAQWLEAAFPGPEFDGFGADKVLLFAGACTPLVVCAVLALRVSRTRWTALIVDGLMTTVGLFVVAEVVATPGIRPDDAPADLRSMVLLYGGYAAIMLGAAGALCTVSTAALRRSVNAMLGAVACQATAAVCEAMAIVAPHPMWTAGSDAAVALSLLLAQLATMRAPLQPTAPGARASRPKVSPAGMALVVLGVLALPFALALSLANHQPLSPLAESGCAVVFVLVAARLVQRIREDGRVTQDLVRTEEDFRELVESSSDGIAIVDAHLRLLFTSPAARTLLGLSAHRDGETSLLARVEPHERADVAAALHAGRAADSPLHLSVRTADGEHRELEMTASRRPGSDRQVLYLRDVTTRRRRERELERMAYSDHLTGLPNRALLFRELEEAALLPDDRCLLVLDLDGFKAVNDEAGHESGDHLLVEVSRRLRTVVREGDLVARLGGDEFAVLVSGSLEHASEAAQRVVDVLALPHRAGDATFAIGGSVGVAVLGAGGGQVAFREADRALRQAKQAGKGCVRIAGGSRATRDAVVADLAAALDEGQVRLQFDSAVDRDGRVTLVHAVPVWDEPARGSVPGPELWLIAEQQGHTRRLREWLLHHACTEIAGLPDDVTLAVSLRNGVVSPDGLAGMVTAALAATGFPPSRLMLSFTEETLLTSSATLVPELEAVRAMGAALCLDNYGMGQSLFALMARVPLDAVRADLSSLAVRNDDVRALQVLDAIVHITTGLGLTVIAGGVSTPQLREETLATGVQLVHGRAAPHGLTGEDLRGLLAGSAPSLAR